jgi:hypothetical protein
MIKYIALLSMILDHINVILYDRHFQILTEIGRIAYPLFLYMLVRNYMLYTRNKEKYIIRLFVFGFISAPFTYYAFGHVIPLNIMFTLAAAALIMYSLDQRDLFIFFIAAALTLYSEYSIATISLTLAYMLLFLEQKQKILIYFIVAAAMFSLNGFNEYLYVFIVMLLLIREQNISTYTCRSHNKNMNYIKKYGFYIFYPLHLAVIKLFSSSY